MKNGGILFLEKDTVVANVTNRPLSVLTIQPIYKRNKKHYHHHICVGVNKENLHY